MKIRMVQLLLLAAFLMFWEVIGRTSLDLQFLLSRPSLVFDALVSGLRGDMPWDIWITLKETIGGFLLGTFGGWFFGLSFWLFPNWARLIKPYIAAAGSVPVLALAPIMIVWFGIDLEMKIVMAAMAPFFISVVHAYDGAVAVDKEEVTIAKIFKATRLQIFHKVILSASLYNVFTLLRLNIGFAFLGAFIGEFISSEVGLGHRMVEAGNLYKVEIVFSNSAVIIILALSLTRLVALAEKHRGALIAFLSVNRQLRRPYHDQRIGP